MKKYTSFLISSSLIAALSMSSLTPAIDAKANSNSSTQENIDIETNTTLSSTLIEKANSYIKIENNKFVLDEKALNVLTEKEHYQVKKSIEENNEIIKSLFIENNEENINLIQNGNQFKQTVYENRNTVMRAINKKSYVDIDYTWWGAKIYFSHKAVNDLNDYLAVGGFVGSLGASKGIGKFLSKNGIKVSAKFLGPISLFGGAVAWSMSKVDKGKGVYLNCVLYVPATITAV